MLLAPQELVGNTATLVGERLTHLREVQAYTVGDCLRVGVLNGWIGQAKILHMDAVQARLHVVLDTPPPPPQPCTLIIALPRPKMLKRILVDATSLGIKRLCFINSYRVEKSFWSSPSLLPDALTEKCLLGLTQSIDTLVPTITLHKRFRPFVEDELPALIGNSLALVAHPAADTACPRHLTQATTLIIGPEGGFIPFEIDLLRAANCIPVTLGTRVLRVDTVIPTLLGRLLADLPANGADQNPRA